MSEANNVLIALQYHDMTRRSYAEFGGIHILDFLKQMVGGRHQCEEVIDLTEDAINPNPAYRRCRQQVFDFISKFFEDIKCYDTQLVQSALFHAMALYDHIFTVHEPPLPVRKIKDCMELAAVCIGVSCKIHLGVDCAYGMLTKTLKILDTWLAMLEAKVMHACKWRPFPVPTAFDVAKTLSWVVSGSRGWNTMLFQVCKASVRNNLETSHSAACLGACIVICMILNTALDTEECCASATRALLAMQYSGAPDFTAASNSPHLLYALLFTCIKDVLAASHDVLTIPPTTVEPRVMETVEWAYELPTGTLRDATACHSESQPQNKKRKRDATQPIRKSLPRKCKK